MGPKEKEEQTTKFNVVRKMLVTERISLVCRVWWLQNMAIK